MSRDSFSSENDRNHSNNDRYSSGRDRYRSIGALIGLVIGLGLMSVVGQSGMLPGAIFGAGGCVLGGICGEKVHSLGQRGSR